VAGLASIANINHGLLLPMMLGPPRTGPETELFRRNAYKDIPGECCGAQSMSFAGHGTNPLARECAARAAEQVARIEPTS
jgi:hypothetical protein